ncbi:MAG: hypothetical protein KAH44_09635, partial [Oricola sp.]|nr:hypothetical protein [Oricola sp.]
ILRDDDDHSGQTIRQWAITVDEPGGVMLTDCPDGNGSGFVMLRRADIPLLIADLEQARALEDAPRPTTQKDVEE